jgi:uncharacterized phiE125 gp8 family phage protein
MAIKISIQPTVEPVSLDEAKSHLRIDSTDQDVLIASYIKTARVYCEQFQNRSYITQSWELWLDSFPSVDFIEIPLPPLQSVTSIAYYDMTNTATTVLAAAFGTTYFVDSKNEPGKLCLGYGASWPTTTLRPYNGVCITFVSGYGIAELISENIKSAIKLIVGHLYEHREMTTDKPLTEIPMAAESLLWMERVL